MCKPPLFEILKIMDKDNYVYDLDIGPQNHVYYYSAATLYILKNETNKVDLGKALHYLINIMKIVYNNVDSFEMLPPIFFKVIMDIIDSIRRNRKKSLFFQDLNIVLSEKDKDYKDYKEYKENLEPEDVKDLFKLRILREPI